MTHFTIIPALILALGISLILLVFSLWRVVLGAKSSGRHLTTLLMVATASIVTVDFIQVSRTLTVSSSALYSDFACLVLFSAIILFWYQVSSHAGSASSLRRNLHVWAMILMAMTMSGWCYHRIGVRCMDLSFGGLEVVLPGTVDMDDRAYAVTDKGELVPLYRISASVDDFNHYLQALDDKFKNFSHVGIHRDAADPLSNCHGWVFTAGKFLLKGRDVERILCDNNYFVVTTPQTDDLVIYRDEAGLILHTALVQSVLRDGTVITESKWGIDQRFLHLPADQPYSDMFEYYRTERPSHLIKVLDSKDMDAHWNEYGLIDG